MAKSSKRPLAIVSLAKYRKIGSFILFVRALILNIMNHPLLFVTPDPLPADVTLAVDDLEAAETVAKTRVTGSAAARDLEYDKVLNKVFSWQGYVQNLADLSADEAAAIAIINSSGFGLKNHGVRVKPLLEVRLGIIEGSVKLIAKSAGKRVSYDWQRSPDGIAWSELPVTLQAKTTVTGLATETKMYFRVRPVLKDGPAAWSPVVSIFVM